MLAFFDPVSFLLGIVAGALVTYLLALLSWYRMPRAAREHLDSVAKAAARDAWRPWG